MQDLQQLFYLEKLIEHEKERLAELYEQAGIKSPTLSDMPKAKGAVDKLGNLVPQIVDKEAEIAENIRRYTKTREELVRYINRIPNARIKMIVILRYIDQRPWQEVAETIGGKETEYSVKHAVYRYMDRYK